MPTGFTITPDTKIDPNSELAKYATLVPLRAALDRKDTDFVVKFIKDNNLTANVGMRDKRTPLMKLL